MDNPVPPLIAMKAQQHGSIADLVLAQDGRRAAHVVSMVEIRPDTFVVLVLDYLDEPMCYLLGRLADDVAAVEAAYAAALRAGHEDVVHFHGLHAQYVWSHESIIATLARMTSVG